MTLPELKAHLLPVERPTRQMPPKWKRGAVRLARRIGTKKAAYVYGCTHQSIGAWAFQLEHYGEPPESRPAEEMIDYSTYFTVSEACEMLGVGPTGVYHRIRSGELRAVMPSGVYLISPEEVRRLLRQRVEVEARREAQV